MALTAPRRLPPIIPQPLHDISLRNSLFLSRVSTTQIRRLLPTSLPLIVTKSSWPPPPLPQPLHAQPEASPSLPDLVSPPTQPLKQEVEHEVEDPEDLKPHERYMKLQEQGKQNKLGKI